MTSTYVYVEPTTGLRDWMRTQSPPAPVFATSAPKDHQGACCVISRAGGGHDATLDRPLIQLKCFGDENGGDASAAEVANWASSLLESTAAWTPMTAGLYCHGGTVESSISLPDPTTGQSCYVLTVDVTTTAA